MKEKKEKRKETTQLNSSVPKDLYNEFQSILALEETTVVAVLVALMEGYTSGNLVYDQKKKKLVPK